MVRFIRKEFIKMLQMVEWMDSETKQMAIEKAQSITAHIGYSPEILDEQKVLELFDGVNKGTGSNDLAFQSLLAMPVGGLDD